MYRNIHVMGNHILDLEQTEFVMIYERRLVAKKSLQVKQVLTSALERVEGVKFFVLNSEVILIRMKHMTS
jgi:hypothetical protein